MMQGLDSKIDVVKPCYIIFIFNIITRKGINFVHRRGITYGLICRKLVVEG